MDLVMDLGVGGHCTVQKVRLTACDDYRCIYPTEVEGVIRPAGDHIKLGIGQLDRFKKHVFHFHVPSCLRAPVLSAVACSRSSQTEFYGMPF
jgi:hypothetical protein